MVLEDDLGDYANQIVQYQLRGRIESSKWLAELLHSLAPDYSFRPSTAALSSRLLLATDYFGAKEYERAARALHPSSEATDPLCSFVYFHSKLQHIGKQQCVANAGDMFSEHGMQPRPGGSFAPQYGSLLEELMLCRHLEGDPHLLWLEGTLRARVNDRPGALAAVLKSIPLDPLSWESWLLLEKLVKDEAHLGCLLDAISLARFGFMGQFFHAKTLLSLQTNPQATSRLLQSLHASFPGFRYVSLLRGTLHYNQRDFAEAKQILAALIDADPCALEAYDMLSNILYIHGDSNELAVLAQRASEVDALRPESCCVAGNFWSMRDEHVLAIRQFQQALLLDQSYLAAWVLMGHEYLELRQTAAAIECYRCSVAQDSRDYRAWYGLGQTYELLKLPSYALYYFKRAVRARPLDARMWSALSAVQQQLGDYAAAIRSLCEAYRIDCKDASLGERYAKLLLKAGRNEDALGVLEQVHQLEGFVSFPRCADVLVGLAGCRRVLGAVAACR